MKRSRFYLQTKRSAPAQDSANAYLLDKAGYVSQVAAGVYVILPIGQLVMRKIEQIIREEMTAIGASEAQFSALQPKAVWEASGRWDDPNFKGILYYDQDSEMTMAPTHEEPVTKTLAGQIQSYKDLPVIIYQFQTKFRKELRAKSGLLRGREFRMKDLYSYHLDEEGHDEFYEQAAGAYIKIFERMGLTAYRTKASGGIFTDRVSDEFQVICQSGEDEILVDHETKTGFNNEIEDQLSEQEKRGLERVKSIEVGNIFHYGTKYSDAFGLKVLDASGERVSLVSGAYGIGVSRLLGTLAEVNNDSDGLILPESVAPFQVYLIDLTNSEEGEKIYQELTDAGIEVLFDDRAVSAGEKLFDADLIGCPIRLVYSSKTAEQGGVELKERAKKITSIIPRADLVGRFVKKDS